MMTVDTLMTFLGWCSVINIVLLTLTSVLLIFLKEPISSIHSRMFDMDKKLIMQLYFQYLGNYKIAILMLNVIPYFALLSMR